MIKGHSTIVLTDVNTGQETVYDNDNMVTKALEYLIQSVGINYANPLSNINSYPLWQYLLGGIMLFENNLEESVENVTVPAGNKMIGNGVYKFSNSGAVTELGSYNWSESGEQGDGSIKMVWDFTTAQANGTIRSVALSSAAGALIGAGNAASGKVFTSSVIVNETTLKGILDSFPSSGSKVMVETVNNSSSSVKAQVVNYITCVDLVENILLCIKPDTLYYSSEKEGEHFSTTGEIVINKYRLGFSTIGLKDYSYLKDKLESISVRIPDELMNWIGGSLYKNNIFSINSCGKNAYIMFGSGSSYTSAGKEFYILKINENMKPTAYRLINNCDEAIYNALLGVTSDEYLLVRSHSNNKIFKIRLGDSTDVSVIDNVSSTTGSSQGYMLNDRLYYADSTYSAEVVDTKLNKRFITNGYFGSYHINKKIIPVIGNKLLAAVFKGASETRDATFYIRRNCNYLATINNLSTPVEKTANTTMKVTYTLTFDE